MPQTQTLRGMYIGGQWVQTARRFADINPSTGTLYAEAPDGARPEARMAIEAAHAAFKGWAAMKYTQHM